jgi:hypothetical protein
MFVDVCVNNFTNVFTILITIILFIRIISDFLTYFFQFNPRFHDFLLRTEIKYQMNILTFLTMGMTVYFLIPLEQHLLLLLVGYFSN